MMTYTAGGVPSNTVLWSFAERFMRGDVLVVADAGGRRVEVERILEKEGRDAP